MRRAKVMRAGMGNKTFLCDLKWRGIWIIEPLFVNWIVEYTLIFTFQEAVIEIEQVRNEIKEILAPDSSANSFNIPELDEMNQKLISTQEALQEKERNYTQVATGLQEIQIKMQEFNDWAHSAEQGIGQNAQV